MLFNMFSSDMEGEIKCTLAELAEDTKVSGEVHIPEGRARLQEVLGGTGKY